MSQYLELYIKANDEQYIPIGCYSRCTAMYGAFEDYVPYGKAQPLNTDTLNEIIITLKQNIENQKQYIEEEKQNIECITNMKDIDIDEKIEKISECRGYIRDDENAIVENEHTISKIAFLVEMLDDIHYCRDYDDTDFIYAGIECGNPADDSCDD